jgi:hypothetical protein
MQRIRSVEVTLESIRDLAELIERVADDIDCDDDPTRRVVDQIQSLAHAVVALTAEPQSWPGGIESSSNAGGDDAQA